MTRLRPRFLKIAAAIAATSLALAACGNDDQNSGSSEDPSAALEAGGTLTIWSWEGTLNQVVEDFNAELPNVKVELVNAGSGNDHYNALQNAISAGSGGPDIAQVEYFALPQFAMTDALVDLSQFGAADHKDDFSPGPWASVNFNDGVYGLSLIHI